VKRFSRACAAILLVAVVPGCRLFEPATAYALRIELGIGGIEKPHNWSQIKQLANRRAPMIGERAPDFILPALADGSLVQRSEYQAGRPLVLVFGSYT
jgi:hypothetical protein